MSSNPLEIRSNQVAPGLKRFLNQRPPPKPGSTCDMCRADIGSGHSHVVNIDSRALMCTCRPCYLLFTSGGAGGGKYRIVPERYEADNAFALPDYLWEQLQIPVTMAFFFYNSALGERVALYPSPGGATESELSLDAWEEIVELNPFLGSIEDDVEAALFRKTDSGFECYVVPIDSCYELVGRVRRSWKGFDGGQEMWAELNEYFGQIRERAGIRSD